MFRSLLLASTLIACKNATPTPVAPPTEPVPTGVPTPAPAGVLDPDIAAALPINARTGLPVLITGPAELPGGNALELQYDADLSDPITHFGDCLAQVGDCFPSEDSRACVSAVPRCADPGGGSSCCPSACLDAFDLDTRPELDQVVFDTFLDGSCFEGLADFAGGAL